MSFRQQTHCLHQALRLFKAITEKETTAFFGSTASHVMSSHTFFHKNGAIEAEDNSKISKHEIPLRIAESSRAIKHLQPYVLRAKVLVAIKSVLFPS